MIQFRVGVTVLGGIILAGILLLLFSEWWSLFTPKKVYYIKFAEAPGVTRDTPIQMSGILIGRVRNVDLAKDGGAGVTARIDGNREIRQNYVCRIKTTLLGDATLLFVRSTDPQLPDTPVSANDPREVIRGVVAPDPIQVVAVAPNKAYVLRYNRNAIAIA